MSRTTFLELCAAVHDECGLAGNAPVSVRNQQGVLGSLVRWVANADIQIQNMWLDWDFLQKEWSTPVLKGVRSYVRPDDWGMWDEDAFFLDKKTASHGRLLPIEYKEWREVLDVGVPVTGVVSYITVHPNGDLSLHKTPDKNYKLSGLYWMQPQRMVADDDVSVIPERYQRAIIARARMAYAESQEARDVYTLAAEEFKLELRLLETGQHPGQGNQTISTMPFLQIRAE